MKTNRIAAAGALIVAGALALHAATNTKEGSLPKRSPTHIRIATR